MGFPPALEIYIVQDFHEYHSGPEYPAIVVMFMWIVFLMFYFILLIMLSYFEHMITRRTYFEFVKTFFFLVNSVDYLVRVCTAAKREVASYLNLY